MKGVMQSQNRKDSHNFGGAREEDENDAALVSLLMSYIILYRETVTK
jgi:hypothetical protein